MKTRDFITSTRPQVALITNHGYAGVEIPVGGAPDTGGQNLYVNSYARALDRLKYGVTIFARGGFPFFKTQKTREGEEYLTDNIRYVYVPGGGDRFIRKEDIAIALDEEVDWLYEFIRSESKIRGCLPWDFYELINSHYWDAAVMTVLLVERWKNDLVIQLIKTLLAGLLEGAEWKDIFEKRHDMSVANAPAFYLGKMLIEACHGSSHIALDRVSEAYLAWAKHSGYAPGRSSDEHYKHFEKAMDRGDQAPIPQPLSALSLSKRVGNIILQEEPHPDFFNEVKIPGLDGTNCSSYSGVLTAVLDGADRHVWTPHSLGAIKERNFRDKAPEIVLPLKFCERRDHERMICDRTRVIAATSLKIAETLHTRYCVEMEQIIYFPPGVDGSVFRRYSEDEIDKTYDYLSEKSGVPANELRKSNLLFETSRVDFTKRKDLILEAFARIIDDVQDAYLFIGGGPENEVFTEIAKICDSDAGLAQRAFLLGFIPDEHLPMLFSMADIYISASEMEGFGMSVAQAAVSGTPVICSDKIPFAMQYLPGDALIVPAGDVQGFAEAMKMMLQDEKELKERGDRIKEKSRGLDWENLARTFVNDLGIRGLEIKIPDEEGL